MLAPFLVSFLVLFVVVMVAITMASKFFDAKRKKQVSSMLKTATGEAQPEVSISNLLMEPAEEQRSFMERFLEGLDIAQKLQAQMQQAGLDWSPLKFLVMTLVFFVVGAVIGLRFSFMGFGYTSLALGAGFGLLPYFFVRRSRIKRLNKLEEQFPEALEFLARSMRAARCAQAMRSPSAWKCSGKNCRSRWVRNSGHYLTNRTWAPRSRWR